MTARAALSAGATASASAILIALAASATTKAHQSPAGCTSNSLELTVTKDRTLVRNGDITHYTVAVANDAGPACDLTNATVTLTLPAADGTPTGQVVTVASNVDYPAGTAARVLATVPYTVAVDPGVTDAVVEAKADGTLHDAPTDHAAHISKTLGTSVTQPHATLTTTPTPATGQAPLTATYTYTLTNDSPTAVPMSGVAISDDMCASPTMTGGDTNANALLDVGEAWTFTCAHTFGTGGIFTNTATVTATSTVDNLPVPVPPARTTVSVVPPPKAVVLGHKLVPPAQARVDAVCISLPRRLSIHARELAVVRVRVHEQGGRSPEGALVRITGPGFVRRLVTGAQGTATFRVRARRAGTIVVQSDRCPGADRMRVLAARSATSRRVPRLVG